MSNQISFGIYANQNDKRWNTFIEEMNERFSIDIDDTHSDHYYGINEHGDIDCYSDPNYFQTIITLDDYFAEGSVYRVVKDELLLPTKGTEIYVWNFTGEKSKSIFYGYDENLTHPIITEYNGRLFCYKFFEFIPTERQKLQQEIEQLEKELNVKRDKLKGL